jgi:hypothetical protein
VTIDPIAVVAMAMNCAVAATTIYVWWL